MLKMERRLSVSMARKERIRTLDTENQTKGLERQAEGWTALVIQVKVFIFICSLNFIGGWEGRQGTLK